MNSKKNIAASLLCGLVFAATSLPAFAASSTVVVKPADLATSFADVIATPTKWFYYNDENDAIDNTLGSYVVGPSTPPLGTDSIQISVTGTQRRNLATYQFSGTSLAAITTLAFSTYNPSVGNGGSVNRSAYLHFNVDFNGTDTWQRRLVFVPSINGTVLQNTWQEWDAVQGGNAKWLYSGATWPVTGQPGTTAKTWSQILTDYPIARIRVTDSFLGMRVGEPYADGYTENIDGFKLGTSTGTTTFDFDKVEEVTPPTSKQQCKNDGWKIFNNPSFASKKECEKYVKSHKKNGKAEGELQLLNPKQKIKFHVFEADAASNDKHEHENEGNYRVEYWNYDYPGVLHYKTSALCTTVDKANKSVRFMFQIPAGWPGLTGLYIVSYVQDSLTKHGTALYGHAATADLATAKAWCETGVGFNPSMYVVKKGEVEISK